MSGEPPPAGAPSTFVVSRRDFYRRMADSPCVQMFARWHRKLEAERQINHDPGDEDRS